MIDFIKIIILLSSVYLLIALMKKAKYNFKGFELFPFWIFFTFYVYVNTGYDGMYYFPIGYLALYYLIRLIKTNEYIHWYILLIQVVFSIGFIITFSMYEDRVCEGWSFGSLIMFLILFITFIYMLLINFINFIVKKVKLKNN